MATINKQPIIYFFIVIAFLAVFSFLANNPKNISSSQSVVKIGNTEVQVEVAVTPEAQEQGLSGRPGLKDKEGMLFVFDAPAKHYFWMKDMNFPIDMIFLDSNSKVVYIKKNAQPESYPDTFGGELDSKYVLEVVSGFSDIHNIQVGDSAIVNIK
jgi:uncharacterized membrane protein (UPF0127 family)